MFIKRFLSTQAQKKVNEGSIDKRYNLIKDILYGPSSEPIKEPILPSPKNSPVHTNDEYKERDLIERAWCHFKQIEAQNQWDALKSKYISMRNAMMMLQSKDKRLFEECNKNEEYPRFPFRLRVPTDTIGKGWSNKI